MPVSRRGGRGFTLVEMMVVIAIVAILTAVALPSYNKHLQRSARVNAEAILTQSTQLMERYYTANNTYLGGPLMSAVSPIGATGTAVKYNISFVAPPTATAYTVQAVPFSSQASDACATLTLSGTGAQTPAPTTSLTCW